MGLETPCPYQLIQSLLRLKSYLDETFRVSKFTNTVCKGPFRKKSQSSSGPGVCEGKEGPGREALVSPEWGKNRLFLPQVYSGAAGCQEPLLTGAHYLALNGKVGGGVLLPTPSPQAQWKKGSRALVIHRLAISGHWASRRMSQ